LYYAVRAELGFEVDEWDRLPWWKQVMYLSGIRSARADSEQGADLDDEYPLGMPVDYPPEVDDESDLGLNVVRVQFGPEGA
jgi:hypothetical protein